MKPGTSSKNAASAEMTAMVLRTDRSIGLERRPVPIPRDDQVLVDIDLCGICGSDLDAPLLPDAVPAILRRAGVEVLGKPGWIEGDQRRGPANRLRSAAARP